MSELREALEIAYEAMCDVRDIVEEMEAANAVAMTERAITIIDDLAQWA